MELKIKNRIFEIRSWILLNLSLDPELGVEGNSRFQEFLTSIRQLTAQDRKYQRYPISRSLSVIINHKSLIIIVFAYLLICLFYIPSALAQNTEPGITVSPSIEHLDLASNPPEYNLTYTNNTNSDITLSLKAQDFTQLEDSYKIDFLSPKDASNFRYSLSSWISFENNFIELSPKESKTIKVFIDKDKITKGGHYASILAQVSQPENTKAVSVNPVLSSLLFIRASTGQEYEDGKILDFHPTRDGIDYPSTYILRFENSGNVFVAPYGLIQIYDPLGNLVARGILNTNSLDALPESIRRYDTNITNYQKVLLPGFYTATLSMHFGKENKKLTASVKFFSQGSFDFIKIGGALLLMIIFIIYLERKRKIILDERHSKMEARS